MELQALSNSCRGSLLYSEKADLWKSVVAFR